jgi:hypothetical protein
MFIGLMKNGVRLPTQGGCKGTPLLYTNGPDKPLRFMVYGRPRTLT